MAHDRQRPPALTPDLGPPNGYGGLPEQFTPPPQGPPPEQGALQPQGPQPKLHEGSASWQSVMNERLPSFVGNINVLDPHAEEAGQEARRAIAAEEIKSGAHALLREEPKYRAAMHNDLKPVGDAKDAESLAKKAEVVGDIDFWLRTRKGVTIIGGYGEDRESLEAIVKERAVREGFDPNDVTIITMAEGFNDPEMVRRETHDRAVLLMHSAGTPVLAEAYEGEDTSYWRRPGLAYFHNPPSGHRRPLAKPSSESKEMSVPQLIIGSLLVADTDRVSKPKGWMKRWGKEVFSHPGASLRALFSRIVKHGRSFDEFASSLADRGTQVIIPVSRKDFFFHLTQQSRDKLGEHGATVVEPAAGDGYHNDLVFKPEETTAEVDEELAAMAGQAPGSKLARDLETRQRHAELRRAHRRRTHHGAGIGEIASRGTLHNEPVDADKQP